MYRSPSGELVFSPTDLVRYLASPFASWMDRYNLENPGAFTPDKESESDLLIAETGNLHEQAVLQSFRLTTPGIVEISRQNPEEARLATFQAFATNAPIIYQAALHATPFAGYADFVILEESGQYEIWDTKLACSPKPYYAIQLCCYSEMLADLLGEMPSKFGVILGTQERVEFRTEDFIHFYHRVKADFLQLQSAFTNHMPGRPDPHPRADHGRWTSHADKFLEEADHLVRVAGISVGQIKKLHRAGITTLSSLAANQGEPVRKLGTDSLAKLEGQANLQSQTLQDRKTDHLSRARFVVLPHTGPNGEPVGLAALPHPHPADVFFDMEGFPLIPGGLEYLFGACYHATADKLQFIDWWGHDRPEEKLAFEGFIDWAHKRWQANPGMHIYHYASYEVSALRRLSTRHDTRQEEVDDLLRNDVFVDLYNVVRRGLRIGEPSYSIKTVERLYREKRKTDVATAVDSIVQYARWKDSLQSKDWKESQILKAIREYNEDDCISTAELAAWLRRTASEHGIQPGIKPAEIQEIKPLTPEAEERQKLVQNLRTRGDAVSTLLADLIGFHRREEKPMWWRLFDRAAASPESLRDDAACIGGVDPTGDPVTEKQSLLQTYKFDATQDFKLTASERAVVMFSHNIDAKLTLCSLDAAEGQLVLKIGKRSLDGKLGGLFPSGSLIPDEFVNPEPIPTALAKVATQSLAGHLHPPVSALLIRKPPSFEMQRSGEPPVDAAIRIAKQMDGDCLVIQGPPGTGKTYTASKMIATLLADGKRVGVTSNSHKAVLNLLAASGVSCRQSGHSLKGIKVGGEDDAEVFPDNPEFHHVADAKTARAAYEGGAVGGTAWLFCKDEWEGVLDYLFIDEAGQVSLANAVAMSLCARNLVLLGDQMQLEQPIQGSHPPSSGLGVLQYALLDAGASTDDNPVFHAVVPANYGLFLGESRRMHPAVCQFISESIYEARLASHDDCANQKIELPAGHGLYVNKECGIVFSPIEHDGNIQHSAEEVERVLAIYEELKGRPYHPKGHLAPVRPLGLEDFLFIAPYNAQVRALTAALPAGARVGTVDKFQGQEAPVCILSLCSSFGEYGSRGLKFILDRNRINVAISRAECLAIVVADPRIASTNAGTIEDMKLLNVFCKLLTSSETQKPSTAPPTAVPAMNR